MSQQRRAPLDCASSHRLDVTHRRWSWLAASAAAFVLVAAPGAFAQPTYPNQYPAQPYYRTAPQNLEALAQQLDQLALQARNQARADKRGGHGEEVAERLDDFANHANEFRVLLRERDVPSSKINDGIRRLVDDARKVQKERMKANWRDPQVDADWNATLAALDDLNHQFLVANNLAPSPLDIPGYTPQYGPGYGTYNPNDGAVGTSGYGAPDVDRTWRGNAGVMLADLDRRADDAVRLSQNTDLAAAAGILRLRDQIRSFARRAGSLSPAEHDADIREMLQDARTVQSQLATPDVPPQLRDDVSAMVGTLVHLRDMSGNHAEQRDDRDRDTARGTAGYDNDTGIASDRYAMMDVPQLTSELTRRADRAARTAAQWNRDDGASEVSHFQDRVRDFNDRAASMDRDDRRSGLEDLLHDAQSTQRDLARRNAPADLVNQWNAVVDLLVRLRDAS